MCGIAGLFNYNRNESVDPVTLKKMGDLIRRRGPDDEGFYQDPSVRLGLAHRRLSIIDLSGGKQPMSDASGKIWIVFNGEIYNFPELRKELEARGCVFQTRSDTEVIIYLYKMYGERGFNRLNGIFAFAIYDMNQRAVILARDPFGVKPLYYYLKNGKAVFSSEIKPILEEKSVARELDLESLDTFLTFRYNPSPQTLFKDIHKLYPGHFMRIDFEGEAKIESYIHEVPVTSRRVDEREALEEYKRLLDRAVKRQMLSDVPVGLLLSGGVDSALLGFLMQKHSKDKIKTFTIGFPGKGDHNELDDARETAQLIGSDHEEMTLTREEYIDYFCRSFETTEEPIAETTIPALYYVSRLAASHLKVVLAGQGADEPMAGYTRYLGAQFLGKYGNLLRLLPLEKIASLLPRNEKLKRAAYVSRFRSELGRILGIYTIFTPEQKNALYNYKMPARNPNTEGELVERLYSQTKMLKDTLSKILFIDTRMSLSDNLLLFNDKVTMSNSLEMRVPFLDTDLVRFLESLPPHFKLRGTQRKYIHKKAAESWLPKEIVHRKKRGFSTPMDTWLQSDLAEPVLRMMTEPRSACIRFFNPEFIKNMVRLHQSRKENYQRPIFALMSFEIWYRTYFDRENMDLDIFPGRRKAVLPQAQRNAGAAAPKFLSGDPGRVK